MRFSRGCFGSDRESAKGTPDEAHEGGVASMGDDWLLSLSWLRERPPKVDDQGNRRNIHAKKWIAGYGDRRIIRSSTERQMHPC